MCAITQIEENNFSWQRSDSATVILGNKKSGWFMQSNALEKSVRNSATSKMGFLEAIVES